MSGKDLFKPKPKDEGDNDNAPEDVDSAQIQVNIDKMIMDYSFLSEDEK